MARIPSWMEHAIPFALAAVIQVFCSPGCFIEKDPEEAPPLFLNPSSADQGDLLAVTLSAEGADLGRCDALGKGSLEFVFESEESLIEVHSVDLLPSKFVRAFISIDPSATPAQYQVTLRCDSLTDYKGLFEVKQRSQAATFRVEPSSLPAGSKERELDLIGESNFFVDEGSFVLFGDGSQVTVLEQSLGYESEQGNQILRATVDIAATAPQKEVDVVVVTGARTARGCTSMYSRPRE